MDFLQIANFLVRDLFFVHPLYAPLVKRAILKRKRVASILGRKLCPIQKLGTYLQKSAPLIAAEMKIRRGCTDDLEINLFIVDHVCMSEGGGKGRMCFCEENECNSSLNKFQHASPTLPPIMCFLISILLQ